MEYKIHDIDSAPDHSRDILVNTRQAHGITPNLYGILAESPFSLGIYDSIHSLMEKSIFSPTEQLVILETLAQAHNCTYCLHTYSMIAEMMGISKSIISSIEDNNPISDDRLEMIRVFTIRLLESDGWLPELDQQKFIDQGFSPQHILDLVGFVAMKTISTMVNRLAGTPLDQEPTKNETTH